MNLKDKNGNLLKLTNKKLIEDKIKILKEYSNKNPTKDYKSKIQSLIGSEIFSTLFTEGHISSRREIKETIKHSFSSETFSMKKKILNYLTTFAFTMKPKEFSISNFFTMFKLISIDNSDDKIKLPDGKMFRDEDVFIDSNKLNYGYKGFDPEKIQNAFTNLCNYLNNSEDDIYLKAIIGHIYFEMIHPFYDFNGRLGRLIPLWVFSNVGRKEEMLYFATAINNYRDQYLSMFKKNIDPRTNKVNLDRMILKILDFLIINQKQYIWIKQLENKYLDKTNKSFSVIQKNIIWNMMIKLEISNSIGWIKFTKDNLNYIEKHISKETFSKETIKLKKAGIIKISDSKPRKYFLNNYKLFKVSN